MGGERYVERKRWEGGGYITHVLAMRNDPP